MRMCVMTTAREGGEERGSEKRVKEGWEGREGREESRGEGGRRGRGKRGE